MNERFCLLTVINTSIPFYEKLFLNVSFLLFFSFNNYMEQRPVDVLTCTCV